ncbi:hypothetical protein EW146_g9001 [Bondarzewia mesenterica]|uniref:Uncharacterized protein n=1 Tax=Bondarzewia mesenterica TaxID=1095465 RepID=A0A4S4LBR5_9AGAM|nr:hypothetical protein EW146_g9001 [Bondarzewia mesenterica]
MSTGSFAETAAQGMTQAAQASSRTIICAQPFYAGKLVGPAWGTRELTVTITMSHSNSLFGGGMRRSLRELKEKTQLILSQIEHWNSTSRLLPSIADALRREADNLLSRCDGRVSESELAQLRNDVESFKNNAAQYLLGSDLATRYNGHIMPPGELAASLNSAPQASGSTPIQQSQVHITRAPHYVANRALHPPPKPEHENPAAVHPTQPGHAVPQAFQPGHHHFLSLSAVGGGPTAIPNPPFNQFNAHGDPTPGWGGSNAPLNVHGNPAPGSWHSLNAPPNAHGNPAPGSWQGSNAPPNAHGNPTPGYWHGSNPSPNQFDAHGNPTPGFWYGTGNTNHGGSQLPPSGNDGSSA